MRLLIKIGVIGVIFSMLATGGVEEKTVVQSEIQESSGEAIDMSGAKPMEQTIPAANAPRIKAGKSRPANGVPGMKEGNSGE